MSKKEHLIKSLKKFLEKLGKDINIEKVILFGSRARGDFNSQSDIDLIIVSDGFENMSFFERVKKVSYYWEIDYPVDFICYSPKEFNKLKNQISVVREAIKEGIEI